MSRRFTGGTLSSGILYINGGYLSSATVPVTGFPFTMACWAFAADATNFNPLMAFSDEGNGNDAIIVSIDSELLTLRYIVGGGAYVATHPVDDAEAHYIALVCESATSKKLYANGDLVATITDSAAFPATFDRYYVGAEYRTTRFTAHDATIALPAVWNVALSPAEVQRLAAGDYPEKVRGSSIVAFHGLFRACSPEPDISGGTNDLTVAGTGTAATGASGPPISYDSPIYINSRQLREKGKRMAYKCLDTLGGTVSSTAISLETFGFSAANVAAARMMTVTCNANDVVVTVGSGETPTATFGRVVPSGLAYDFDLADGGPAVRLIRRTVDATVTVELFK